MNSGRTGRVGRHALSRLSNRRLHAHESSPLFILTGQAYSALLYSTSLPAFRNYLHMKVIRHAGVDSRMIILDDQARQQMTLHFQLSLQHNFSAITGFVRHTACLITFHVHTHSIRRRFQNLSYARTRLPQTLVHTSVDARLCICQTNVPVSVHTGVGWTLYYDVYGI